MPDSRAAARANHWHMRFGVYRGGLLAFFCPPPAANPHGEHPAKLLLTEVRGDPFPCAWAAVTEEGAVGVRSVVSRTEAVED